MLARTVRLALVFAVLGAVVAASAAAHNMYPTQHAEQRMSLADALPGVALDAPLAISTSAKCENGTAGIYPCKNVDLEGFVPLPMLGGATGNDIWGWTDPETGREYALMATSNSTGFVDVTDPRNPTLVGVMPTRGTPDMVLWRDVKVDGNYAFVVSEISGSGMQVFDLTRLRGASGPQVFQEDHWYRGPEDQRVSNTHNISINEQTDVAYLVGTNTCEAGGESGGLHMVDIRNPLEPKFLGCALVDHMTGEEPDNYVHDVECVIYDGPDQDYQGREICFGSNENIVAIYDVTDKSNPVVISETGYPQAQYTHQGSLTEDKRYFLFGDELDEQTNGQNTTTYILNVDDLDNPPTPAAFTHESVSIDHNMYTHDGRVYQSNYAEGLRILDYDNQSLAAGQLSESGYFDVVPGLDYPEFAGTWSNYRFASGTVVVSAIENHANGLFVLKPTLAPRGVEGTPTTSGQFGGREPSQGAVRDTRKPNLGLRMRRVQDVDRLRLRVTPDEAVALLAGARVSIGKAARVVRFRKARRNVSTGQRATLRLKLSQRNKRALKRAIRQGKRPRASVTVSASDVSRNAIVKKRRVRLKR
jgi:choice-of-anchor B domain-containing protein